MPQCRKYFSYKFFYVFFRIIMKIARKFKICMHQIKYEMKKILICLKTKNKLNIHILKSIHFAQNLGYWGKKN